MTASKSSEISSPNKEPTWSTIVIRSHSVEEHQTVSWRLSSRCIWKGREASRAHTGEGSCSVETSLIAYLPAAHSPLTKLPSTAGSRRHEMHLHCFLQSFELCPLPTSAHSSTACSACLHCYLGNELKWMHTLRQLGTHRELIPAQKMPQTLVHLIL